MISTTPIVFVVDDDASVRTSLRRMLQSEGYEIHAFSSPSNLFAEGRPDSPCCLVLDVQLPEVDGLSYQETLTRMGVRVPIIFITGWGDIPMSVRAMKAGAADFLGQPFARAQSLACVRTASQQDTPTPQVDRLLAGIPRT